MLQIYTDAGARNGHVAGAALIFDTEASTLVKSLGEVWSLRCNSAVAELKAIDMALHWVSDNLGTDVVVAFYLDHLGVVQALHDYIHEGRPCRIVPSSLTTHVCLMCTRFRSIDFKHISGHQAELNPNVCCDRLCTSLLQWKEAALCTQ